MKETIQIERVNQISKNDFYDNYVSKSRPVVIKGVIDDWKALNLWSFEYFLNQFGESNIQAYKLNSKGQCDVDTTKGSPTQIAALADCINSFGNKNISERWAVAASVDLFPAQMRTEFNAPDYCADGKFLRSMLFAGPTGVVSPLHQDLPENLYTMIKGTKRITLFAPTDKVYPNSRLSNLPNHSQIDVEQPNYERFPELKTAQPYIVELERGETLFIPSFWWHHLRNIEPSIAMNFWWSQGWKMPIAWAASIYKKYRKI